MVNKTTAGPIIQQLPGFWRESIPGNAESVPDVHAPTVLVSEGQGLLSLGSLSTD